MSQSQSLFQGSQDSQDEMPLGQGSPPTQTQNEQELEQEKDKPPSPPSDDSEKSILESSDENDEEEVANNKDNDDDGFSLSKTDKRKIKQLENKKALTNKIAEANDSQDSR